MAKKKKSDWIGTAGKSFVKKGTVGAFTKYCGGKVTDACIAKGLASPNETIRKRAQFAKNVRARKRK